MLNLRYCALLEAFGPGHDEGAEGMRALDVGIVIDLDAPGRLLQSEDVGHAFQQLRLGAVLGHDAGPAVRVHWQARAP